MAEKVMALNPEGNGPTVGGRGLATRSPKLARKTVFLVDVGFENSGDFMVQLERWFKEHQPETNTTVLRLKGPFDPDPEAYSRIAEQGDAAVLGVGL